MNNSDSGPKLTFALAPLECTKYSNVTKSQGYFHNRAMLQTIRRQNIHTLQFAKMQSGSSQTLCE